MRQLLSLLTAILVCSPVPAQAQGKGKDPNLAFTNEVIVAQLPGRSIAARSTETSSSVAIRSRIFAAAAGVSETMLPVRSWISICVAS